MLKNGETFERYTILSHLARGGSSDIYRARDNESGRIVVLKIPDAGMIGDLAQYERFQRELAILNTLDHPAIQKGLQPGKQSRTPFLVAEMVEGRSLREIIEEEAPLPPAAAIPLIRKISEGVAYCHAKGIVHRDLKPDNILITAEGQPVIIDFGLALTPGGRRVTYPSFSGMAGTPEYMAPEQIESRRGDRRTDIYAIGVILFEMLAGYPPFQGDTPVATMGQHLYAKLPRLDRIQNSVSAELAAVVAKCLQRNPENRYSDLDEFFFALDHLDSVDVSILDTLQSEKVPIWKNQAVLGIAIGILILVALAAVGLLLQHIKAP